METTSVSRRHFSIRSSFVVLIAAIAAGSVCAAPTRVRHVAAVSAARGPLAEALAADNMRPAERAFLEKGQALGRLQAQMAELGASQAASSEVRSHAEQLKSDTRQLVDALTALTQKKGVGDGSPTSDKPAEVYTQLAARTGGDFDREFVRVMAALHEDTIAVFEQAAAESRDTDVRDLAAAQLPMLRAHRNKIVELKKIFD